VSAQGVYFQDNTYPTCLTTSHLHNANMSAFFRHRPQRPSNLSERQPRYIPRSLLCMTGLTLGWSRSSLIWRHIPRLPHHRKVPSKKSETGSEIGQKQPPSLRTSKTHKALLSMRSVPRLYAPVILHCADISRLALGSTTFPRPSRAAISTPTSSRPIRSLSFQVVMWTSLSCFPYSTANAPRLYRTRQVPCLGGCQLSMGMSSCGLCRVWAVFRTLVSRGLEDLIGRKQIR
jgi:hypothetical protein